MYEFSPKRLNSLCKTFQPWEVSGYESFCLEFEQLFPQAPEACSQTKVTGSLSCFTCSNKSCPLPHMTALLLLRFCTPRHHFLVCGMNGMRGCRRKGEGRTRRRDLSGVPAGNPRQVVRKQWTKQPLQVAKTPSRRDRQWWLPLRRLLFIPEGPTLLIKCYHHTSQMLPLSCLLSLANYK